MGGGKKPQVKTQGHQLPPDGPLDRRDTIQVEGRIPGWLNPNGALHRCQCVGHGFATLIIHPSEKQTN